MARTVAQKMGVKPGTRAVLLHAPAESVAAMELPALEMGEGLRGEFGYIHLFVRDEAEMERELERAKPHLGKGGMLWLSWIKKSAGGTMTIKDVIRIAYDQGLVESTALRIDETWSGIKLTHPKPGKVYNNSYGTLPGR